MKKFKKLTLGAVTLTLLVSLAGCNHSNNAGNSGDIFNNAKTNVSTIKNYDADMNVDLSIQLMGNDTNLTLKSKVTSFVDPIKMKVSTIISGALNQTNEMYAVQKDGKVITYVQNDGAWSAKETSAADMTGVEQYDAAKNMKLYLDSFKDYKETGTENINGNDTIKYEGMLSGDALKEAIKSSGVLESLSGYAKDIDVNKIIDSSLADTPTTIWIEKESSLPVKYSMDMKDVLSKLMNEVLKQSMQGVSVNITVNKVLMDMTLSNINQAADFTIPQEALNVKPK